MSDIDDLISRLPIGDIAGQLGVDPATATSAVQQALPALLSGLEAQTGNEETAQKLAGALEGHQNDLADGEIKLDDVDTADGSKIVANIFGDKTDEVAHALSGAAPAAAVDSGLIKKLLPILAPIVMSFVMSKVLKGGAAGGTTAAAPAGGAGDLGSILGSALGGNAAGGLGNVLGSILGGQGGGAAAPGGALGSILGSILGGKK